MTTTAEKITATRREIERLKNLPPRTHTRRVGNGNPTREGAIARQERILQILEEQQQQEATRHAEKEAQAMTTTCPNCHAEVTEENGAYITAAIDSRLYCYESCVETCDQCGTNDLVINLVQVFAEQPDGEYHRFQCHQCHAEKENATT